MMNKLPNKSISLKNRKAVAPDPLKKVLRRIRSSRDFPTISKYIIEINQKLSEASIQSSASELANIILKDYALTNKLLKLVNSAFYGLAAGKVTTVTRAVILLGYENVRLAAISLVLFEHFKKKSVARDLKDANISSFWCGLMAKDIAKMFFTVDPEEAFICGLLHQLGKLLTIYHMPDEYRDIRHLITQENADELEAVKQVTGITYKSLGQAVAKQWNFPDSIYKSMITLSEKKLENKNQDIEPLCILANLVNALCHIIQTVPMDLKKSAFERLLDCYRNHIDLSYDQLNALMAAGYNKLQMHAHALQLSTEDSDFMMRLAGKYRQITDRSEQPKEDIGKAFRLAGAEEIASSNDVPEPNDTVGIIMEGIQEISSAMMGNNDINDISLMSLESIYRAMQCQHAILFIHDSRSKMMEARYGYGAGINRMIKKTRFKFDASSKEDLFLRALRYGKDLIVEDTHTPEMRQLIPSWYRQSMDAEAFIFMPIAYQNICVGAYYGDFNHTGPPVTPLEHKYLAMLRNQLILAIKMER